MIAWDNESIAEKLLEYADLLEQQDANPYRVGAYRRAARVVATHPEPLTELSAREGAAGSDLEPVYRALYLGLACGLVRTRVSPSEIPYRESFSA